MLYRTAYTNPSEYCQEHGWNSTDTSQSSHLDDLRWFAYKITAPCIIAGGMLGNLLNMAVLTRPSLNGVTYVYLSGLAVADLGVMLFVIPMVLRLNKANGHSAPAAYFHAHVELFATNSFMASSIFIVCFLTVDRYISVCLPTTFRSVHTKHNARLAIAASYLFGTLVSCPLAALKTICLVDAWSYSFQENVTITTSFIWLAYLWASETLVRFGPACILAVLNACIILKFRKVAANRKRFRAASDKFRVRHLLDSDAVPISIRNKNYQEEKRLITMLTSIIVTFFITMTPSAILSLLYSEQRDHDFLFQSFRAVANNLELCNFALNFYVYFLCSKEFRKVFRTMLLCRGSVDRPVTALVRDDFSRCATTVNRTKSKSSPNVQKSSLQPEQTETKVTEE